MDESFAQFPQLLVTFFSDLVGSNPSGDILLLIAGAVIVVLLGFWGRAKLISVAIAAYAAIAILSTTFLFDWIFGSLGVAFTTTAVVIVVLIVAAVLYFMIHYGLGGILSEDRGFIASSIILAISIVGMVFMYSLTILPADVLSGFSNALQVAFTGSVSRVIWFLAPIIVIGATRD